MSSFLIDSEVFKTDTLFPISSKLGTLGFEKSDTVQISDFSVNVLKYKNNENIKKILRFADNKISIGDIWNDTTIPLQVIYCICDYIVDLASMNKIDTHITNILNTTLLSKKRSFNTRLLKFLSNIRSFELFELIKHNADVDCLVRDNLPQRRVCFWQSAKKIDDLIDYAKRFKQDNKNPIRVSIPINVDEYDMDKLLSEQRSKYQSLQDKKRNKLIQIPQNYKWFV